MFFDDNEVKDVEETTSFGVSRDEGVTTTAAVTISATAPDCPFWVKSHAVNLLFKTHSVTFSDSLNLRRVSKEFKGVVDKAPLFQTGILYHVLRKGKADALSTSEVFTQFPHLYKEIINNRQEMLKDNQPLEAFFKMILLYLKVEPQIVNLLVRISVEISLKPENFKALGEEIVSLFKFLTQPIERSSEGNQEVILNYVSGLSKKSYTKKQCEDLEASINATFEVLRGRLLEKAYVYRNLQRVNLTEANLTRANLIGFNLTRAVLTRANFGSANLTGANLQGAYLYSANLTGANLTRANLAGAHLTEANLTEADLAGANLSGADLMQANFGSANLMGANLTKANLRMAKLEGANFEDADLSGAELFTKDTIKDFIEEVEKSVSKNSARILPVVLAIRKETLDQIDSETVGHLKSLGYACLIRLLANIKSVEALYKLFNQVSVKDNVFRREIYPEVLTLIANTYLCRSLSCEAEDVENDFRKKLIEEISKKMSVFGFFNKKLNERWDDLLHRINKTELKSSRSFKSRPRMNQM